jgi:hypothetical protein
VNTTLIDTQPEVAGPVAGEGLGHIKQGGSVQRPALDQVEKCLLCLVNFHSCNITKQNKMCLLQEEIFINIKSHKKCKYVKQQSCN